jgi:predicted SAM-dependent methyltransferase
LASNPGDGSNLSSHHHPCAPCEEAVRMDISKLSSLKAGTAGKLFVSPFVTLRWKEGKVWILPAQSKEAISTTDQRVLLVLNAFSTPKDPQDIYKELAHLNQAFLFSTIAALWQNGVLIAADEADRAAADHDAPALTEESGDVAQGYARSIAVMSKTIADDLQAFATDTPGGGGDAGWKLDLAVRLGRVHSHLSAIVSELEKARPSYLEAQLARLKISPSTGALKLHLGSGASSLEGWINIDMSPTADLSMHLGWSLPFEDASADCVYLSHVLEHLYYKDEALSLLTEIGRVLAPRGIVRLVVPDIEKCIRAYAHGDQEFFETRKKYWPYSARYQTPLEHFLEYAGAGIRPGDFWGHKYGYDFETLATLLREAGFSRVEQSEYMKSEHGELRIDAASQAAGFMYREASYSLFVEAIKE